MKIYTSILFLVLSCSQPIKNKFINQNSDKKFGIVYTGYGSLFYNDLEYNDQYFKLLKSTGANTFSILYTCYTENEKSHKIDCDSEDSPKINSIQKLMRKAKKTGLKTSLRVYVDLKNNRWRANWHPENLKLAFKELERILVMYSIFAEKEKIESLIIGSEYEGLTIPMNKELWVNLIKSIKKNYSGRLIYAANGNTNKKKIAEYQWVPFWEYMDYIGINHYPSLRSNSDLLKEHSLILSKLTRFSNKFNKKLEITEVGFPISERGVETPFQWDYSKKINKNLSLHHKNMSAFFEAATFKNISGIYLWRFLPNEGNIHPLGYIVDDPNTTTLLQKLGNKYLSIHGTH